MFFVTPEDELDKLVITSSSIFIIGVEGIDCGSSWRLHKVLPSLKIILHCCFSNNHMASSVVLDPSTHQLASNEVRTFMFKVTSA